MNGPYSWILLIFSCLLTFGCSKSTQTTTANNTTSAITKLSNKAELVEEKVVNGEALTEADVKDIPSNELRIIRNAVFARHGRKYDSPGLGDYFNTRSWYKPKDDYKDTDLTAIDKANTKVVLVTEQPTPSLPSNSTATSTPAPTAPASPPISSSNLTTEKVQRAVDTALARLRQGGTAKVIGIQEVPRDNSARADIQYTNFQYDNGTPYVGKQNFTGHGFAILSRYNDGRWIVTHVQLWSIDSITTNVEVK